jgi:hypothetical protein
MRSNETNTTSIDIEQTDRENENIMANEKAFRDVDLFYRQFVRLSQLNVVVHDTQVTITGQSSR